MRQGHIGPYEILEVLGRGGMGVVYRARDRKSGDQVALKTIPVARAILAQSLRHEIQALARLRHPGIVPIVDEGLHEGIPWYAMQLVEGPSLRTKMTSGRLPLETTVGLVLDLCPALAFLHGEGFVHRDLKPENILLQASDDPESWRPILMDFGLAARFGNREALETSGGASGTYAYMAPEQAMGQAVDARADLYALGCLLYELLTGQPPFVGETPAHVLHQHLRAEAPPPSQRIPGLPASLDELMSRLLAKEPTRRLGYATDLERWLGQIMGPRATRSEGPPARTYLYRPRFTGRAGLLTELQERMSRTRAGSGVLWLIGGQSGAGKTRLASELMALARQEERLVQAGEGLLVGGGALHLWSRPLQAVADRFRAGELQDLGPKLRLLAGYEPSVASLPALAELPEPPALPPKEAQLRLFVALTETLAALGENKPVLLVLDDLQWADELSLQFLVFLLKTKALQKLPWFVLGTYRAEEREEFLQKLSESALAEHRELAGFDRDAVSAMVADMLALDTAPELFVRFLERQSEGNPYFVAEYLQTAVAEGVLSRDAEGHWHVLERQRRHLTEATYEALPLPGSLRELIGRRLNRLEAPELELAQIGAVLGRQWESSLLISVAGQPESEIGSQLSRLFRRQVLEENLEPGRPASLRFVHDKLRETAYEALEQDRRQAVHRRAAGILETQASTEELRTARSAELAYHWLGAAEPVRALPHLRTAAASAERNASPREALRFYQQALEAASLLAPGSPAAQAEEIDLLHHCQNVLVFLGRFEEALQMAKRMEQRATEQGSELLAARALRNQAVVRITQGRPQEALPLLDRAIPVLERIEAFQLLAGALSNRQQALYQLGRLQESLAEGKRALEYLHPERDLAEIGNTSQVLGFTCYELGLREEARQSMDRALTSFQKANALTLALLCETNLGTLAFFEGRYHSADRLLRHATEQSFKIESWVVAVTASNKLGSLEAELGDLEAARRHLREALRLASEIGDTDWGLRSALALGRTLLRQDRTEAAEQAFREGLLLAQEGTWNVAALLGGLAWCQGRRGQLQAAGDSFEQAAPALRSVPQRDGKASALLDRAEARLELDLLEAALLDCREASEAAGVLGRPDLQLRTGALRARVLLRLQRWAEAREATAEAQSAMASLELTEQQQQSLKSRPDLQSWRQELASANPG